MSNRTNSIQEKPRDKFASGKALEETDVTQQIV